MKKKVNKVDDAIEQSVQELIQAAIENEDRRIQSMTLHPKTVEPVSYSLANEGPTALIHRFADHMLDAQKGKVRVAGTMVVQNDRGRAIDIVNFTAAGRKWGSTWNESHVHFDNEREYHDARGHLIKRLGLEVSVDEIPNQPLEQPNSYTVFRGFKDYTDIACRLIPKELTPNQQADLALIAKIEAEHSD